MAKKVKKSFEERIWTELINPAADGNRWVQTMIDSGEKRPDEPFADSAPILKKMLASGITKEEIGRFSRHQTFEAVGALLSMLEEEGFLTRKATGIHGGLLNADPSGLEGGPGSWPVPAEAAAPDGKVIKVDKGGKVAFSPDGRLLAVGVTTSTSGRIRIWELEAKQVRNEFATLPNLRALAWSPDGQKLAISSHAGVTCIVDPTCGRTIWKSKSTGKETIDLSFSADGTTLAGAGMGNLGVSLYNAVDGHLERQIGEGGIVHKVSASTTDPTLLAFTMVQEGFWLVLWNSVEKREVWRIAAPKSSINTLRFAKDGRKIIVGSWNFVWVISADNGDVLYSHPIDRLYALAIAPDSRAIAVSESDKPVRLIDLETGAELVSIDYQPKYGVFNLDFSSDGKWLAVGEWKNSVVIELAGIGAT